MAPVIITCFIPLIAPPLVPRTFIGCKDEVNYTLYPDLILNYVETGRNSQRGKTDVKNRWR